MEEYIGKAVLNLEYYSGVDFYSDGEIENTLLDLVKKYTEQEYDRIIEEQKSWPILYHLSSTRGNLIEWIDFRKDQDIVLEIGAGCGALTGILTEKARQVTCVELSKRRSMINAVRHRSCDNLQIMVGNFEEIEKGLNCYDVVTLIGVLEYAGSYLSSETPHLDLLKKAAQHLKPGGRLILAIENRFGMKYWAGCPEDHTGRGFDSIEGYPGNHTVRTFSRKELELLLDQAGFGDLRVYYPYPDYKLPHTIYSDSCLPQKGSLGHSPNLSGDRMTLFDEGKAYDSVLEAGLFPEFSNSFLMIAVRRA